MPTGDSGKEYAGEVTTYVIVACIVAASGGALFGYVHHAILSAKVLTSPSCISKMAAAGTLNQDNVTVVCRYDNGVTGGVISMVRPPMWRQACAAGLVLGDSCV